MADRDFTIPMGPDRTSRLHIPEVIPGAGSSPDQTIAQPPISTADLRGIEVDDGVVGGNQVDAWLNSPMEETGEGAVSAPQPTAPVADGAEAPISQTSDTAESPEQDSRVVDAEAGLDAPVEADDGEAYTGGAYVGEPTLGSGAGTVEEPGDASPVNDVAASLGALRDSIGQGRELKARERDREELAGKIEVDREELADRDDILANYQSIVAEQDSVIAQSTQERDEHKAELSRVTAETEETSEALKRMRDYHDVQLEPLETALGRAQATADQAKNDERSRKSELNSAESEVRRAEDGDDANTARARLEVVRAAHDEAVARSNAAKEALEEAQRAYDDLRQQVEQAEAPLERSLDDLGKRADELKDEIARLGDIVSDATKRRQYCDSVYQYPAETEKLRESVAADEGELARMDEENDELRDLLAQSKAKSMKAKVLIGAVIAFVVVLILLFWYLSSR